MLGLLWASKGVFNPVQYPGGGEVPLWYLCVLKLISLVPNEKFIMPASPTLVTFKLLPEAVWHTMSNDWNVNIL